LYCLFVYVIFFFNDTATTEIYTLSLHDALPISWSPSNTRSRSCPWCCGTRDRKSTRLNSSHMSISYAVFCLKKKKKQKYRDTHRSNSNKKKKTRIHQPI